MKKILTGLGIVVIAALLCVPDGFCKMMIADPYGGGGGGEPPEISYITVQDSRDNHLVSGATVKLYNIQGQLVFSGVTNASGQVMLPIHGSFGYRVTHPAYHTLTGFRYFAQGTTTLLLINPLCGDGLCDVEVGESPESCPADCVVCGDGICSPLESPESCPEDCGPVDPCAGVNCDAFDYDSAGCGSNCNCCHKCYDVAGRYVGCTTPGNILNCRALQMNCR